MKAILPSLLFSCAAFGANFPLQKSYLLDAGVTSFTTTDTGGGTVTLHTCYPGAARIRVSIAENNVPPAGTPMRPSGSSTYSTLSGSTPNIAVAQNWGDGSYWCEATDVSGNPLTPRQVTNELVLPMIEPTTPAVGAYTMPREVVGVGRGFTDRITVNVPAGAPITSQVLRITGDDLGYMHKKPIDSKAEVQVNQCAWIDISNATVTFIDAGYANRFGGIGSAVSLRELTVPIPDGCIVTGDNTIASRTNRRGHDGVTNGWTLVDVNFQSATQVPIVSFTKSGSTVTVLTSGAHGFSGSPWVYIMAAPGIYAAFNGNRQITVTDSTHFTYTVCANAISIASGACSLADGVYINPPPQNTAGCGGSPSTCVVAQVAYVARNSIPFSQFVQADLSMEPVGPGNPTTGASIWKTQTIVTPGTPGNNFETGAHCSDCHFRDGEDMNLFGASNRRLRMRGGWHGLTSSQMSDVVAFIRSAGTIPATGQWYNPAFQPGPGMDSHDVDTFMAGAGFGARAMNDQDLKQYFFPGDDYSVAAPTGHMNWRQIPMYVAFQTWRQWIASFWPGDYNFPTTQWVGSPVAGCRDAALSTITPGSVSSFAAFHCVGGRTNPAMTAYQNDLRDWADTNNYGKLAPGCAPFGCSDVFPIYDYENPYIMTLYSALQLTNVGIFNVNYRLGFVDKYDTLLVELYGASTYGQWTRGIAQAGVIFSANVHFQSIGGGERAKALYDGTVDTWDLLAHLGYIVDAVIGAGNRRGNFVQPFDTGYLFTFSYLTSGFYTGIMTHILAAQEAYDWPSPFDSQNVLISALEIQLSSLNTTFGRFPNVLFTPLSEQTAWYTQWAQNQHTIASRWAASVWCSDINNFDCNPTITTNSVSQAYWSGAGGSRSVLTGWAGVIPALYTATNGFGVAHAVVQAFTDDAQAMATQGGSSHNFNSSDRDAGFVSWGGKQGPGGDDRPNMPRYANCSCP